MGFFGNELRETARSKAPARAKAPARGVHIPIQAMQQLGCKACPRRDSRCHTPRMEPTGPQSAEVLVLWPTPTATDDKAGEMASGQTGEVVRDYLRQHGIKAQHMAAVRCHEIEAPAVNETECCRGYGVEHIRQFKPRVIVGVGDAPLAWATGYTSGNAMAFRGRKFPVNIGGHVCWFVCVAQPYFKRGTQGKRRSEHEIALDHDLAAVRQLLDSNRSPWVAPQPYDKGVELITGAEPGDMQRLEDALNWAAVQPLCAVDYETNGFRPHMENPLIWCASFGTYERAVSFCMDDPRGWGTEGRMRQVRGLWGEFLLFSNTKVVHNLGMELEWTEFFWGKKALFHTQWEDTMIMAYVLDGRAGTKALEVQTLLEFGFNLKAQSTVDFRDWLRTPVLQGLRYNGMDGKWTHRLAGALTDELHEQGMHDIYEGRRRLAPVLTAAAAKGVPVDREFADSYDKELEEVTRKVERELGNCPEVRQYERKFGRFSPSNPDNVLKLLRDVCDRDEVKREDRDGNVKWTTDEEALGAIPDKEVPSASLVLRHRAVEKLRGTYLEPIRSGRVISPHDNRIHTRFTSTRAITGRLASDDPNLQNIPTRTPEGRRIRHAIMAELDGWIAALDYGQIEARVIGMASEDDNLMRYQWSDYDIHGHWAKRITEEYPKVKDWIVKTFSVDWEEKGHKTLRQETKNKWVFPQFFGSAARSCAASLHIPEDVADKLAKEFWDEFKGVRRWQTWLMKFFEKHLYVETLDGFRRRGPMSLNEIINHPIQGTAARIVTAAMTELGELAVEEDDEELQSNLNIHDDLSHWLADPTLGPKLQRIAAVMCRPRFKWITVPIIVEAKVGPRWDQLEEVAVFRSDVIYNLRNPYK